jgi:hypothetical protein
MSQARHQQRRFCGVAQEDRGLPSLQDDAQAHPNAWLNLDGRRAFGAVVQLPRTALLEDGRVLQRVRSA